MTIAIGVDPASGKETCIWKINDYVFVKPQKVRSVLEKILVENPNCIIAWDAPISFSDISYSDRNVDKVTRAWAKEKVKLGLLEKSAVNALPFSGLSHWVISCQALGFPFGKNLNNLKLYEETQFSGIQGQFLIEVHPAVSMACLWVDKGIKNVFPVYKKTKESRRIIVEELNLPEACIESDDILDAYVAFLMADMFIKRSATSLCQPANGSYVLPNGKSFSELSKKIDQ